MIRLEPFAEEHVPGVEEMLADRDFIRFTRVPDPPPPDYGRTWLERYAQARAAGTREAFAIVEDGEFLGLALAPRIDGDELTAELGYGVSPSARGRGVATEALRQLTDWAFARGMLRLELLISGDNEASKKVAERCGYVREGVLRSTYFKQGLRSDTEIWSLLPGDPRP